MFSRREYEYVMEIAKEGSFSKAAQKLYVSQPALSGAIKKLEKDLYGIPLFDRARHAGGIDTGRAVLP